MKKVLIVEDNPSQLYAYKNKLQGNGLEILSATNGIEALSILKKEKPDLMLLDIMLPGPLSGFDVLSRLRSDPEIKAVETLVVTNLDDAQKTAKELGAFDYIIKSDVTLEAVISKIREKLGYRQ